MINGNAFNNMLVEQAKKKALLKYKRLKWKLFSGTVVLDVIKKGCLDIFGKFQRKHLF